MQSRLRDDDPDYPALVLGNYMLGGGGLNSRLMTRIRSKEGLSYGVGSQLQADAFDKSGGFLTLRDLRAAERAKLEAAFNEEIARALNEGFTEQEVDASQVRLAAGAQRRRARRTSELVARPGAQDVLGPHLAWDAELEKQVQALDAAQIRAALAKYIVPAKFTIVKAGDFAKAAHRSAAGEIGTKKAAPGSLAPLIYDQIASVGLEAADRRHHHQSCHAGRRVHAPALH